jgi:hypothetical protein
MRVWGSGFTYPMIMNRVQGSGFRVVGSIGLRV